MTILQHERLRLRRLTDADLDFMSGLLGDPEVMAFWPAPIDRAGAAEWIVDHQRRYQEDGYGYWLLEDEGRPVGQMGLIRQVIADEPHMGLGWILARDAWGRGYATRVGRLLLGFAAERFGVTRVVATIVPANLASRRVAERLGFAEGPVADYKERPHIVYARAVP